LVRDVVGNRLFRGSRSGRGSLLVQVLSWTVATTAAAADDDSGIWNGSTVSSCEWPNVVQLESSGGKCTAALIHPQLIVTAAHCIGSGTHTVRFGESASSAARTIQTSNCTKHPNWTGQLSGGVDFAYCQLASAVDDVPIIAVMRGCEAEDLGIGANVTLVGFGYTEYGSGLGIKRYVDTEITDIGDSPCSGSMDDEIWIGGDGVGATNGDSGGPAFIQLGDGTWRQFGVVSWGCSGGPTGVDGSEGIAVGELFDRVAWLESSSGLDLTACYDDQGNWEPTVQCTGFPLDPSTASGSWNSGCSGGPSSGMVDTCGAPADDVDAPAIDIVDPSDADAFTADASGRAAITVLAEVEDLGGVASAELWVDGQLHADLMAPPFLWSLNADHGSHTLQVRATDNQGNGGTSSTITITVDPFADDGGAGDESGGDDTGSLSGGTFDDGGTTGAQDPGDDGSSGQPGSKGSAGLMFSDDPGASGCACSTRGSSGGTAWMFGLVLAWGIRRRASTRWRGLIDSRERATSVLHLWRARR
jgi:MYXO-CTERM domain-containing protein